MPQLPTYQAKLGQGPAQPGVPTRRATAEDFGASVGDGRAIQQAAAGFLADTEESEARAALVASSQVRAKYARELDAAKTNGGDLAALKEKMVGELSAVGENFQTKRGVDALSLYTSNTELMFDEQANSINVQRAVAAARLEGAAFLNSAGSIIQSNPLYLTEAVKDADAFASTLTRLPPEQRAEIADRLKKELNMAAALSASRIDPEGTKKLLDGGSWDLTPEQRNAAINKADTEIRAKRADENYARAMKEYQEKEKDEAARDQLFKGIMAGKTSRRDILDNPDLRPTTREHLIVFMETRAKAMSAGERKSDPTVLRDLWLRIHAPGTDPTKIYNGDAIFEAVQKGRINTQDANLLNNLVAQQKDENGRAIGSKLGTQVATVGRALSQDPQFIGQPALVAEIQMEYQARVYDRVNKLREDKKDPNEAFNPANKDWVGSREFIQQSITAAKQRALDAAPQATKVNSQAEYDALEPGTPYIDSKGNRGVKRGAAKVTPAPAAPAAPGRGQRLMSIPVAE